MAEPGDEAPPPSPPLYAYADMRRVDPVVKLAGKVVKGFGRGSRELGIPTANLEPEALGATVDSVPAGVYFGWASVGRDAAVHKMVMSIGWCVPVHACAAASVGPWRPSAPACARAGFA